MNDQMSPPVGVTTATATVDVMAGRTAAVLLTSAAVARPNAGPDGLTQVDQLLKGGNGEWLPVEEVAQAWRNVAAAVIDRNAQIRSVRAAARRLDRSAVLDLAIPSPMNIADHNLRRIALWCRHTDTQLRDARVRLDCREEIIDVTFASAYVDALDMPAFNDVFGPSDWHTVDRLRRVADGDDVLDDDLRVAAEALRQRAAIIATQERIRIRAEEILIKLGYEIIDTFGTRAAGLDSLTLSHPTWPGHIATVVIGSEEIGGKMLRTGNVTDADASADEQRRVAFQADMRYVAEMLRFAGIPNDPATVHHCREARQTTT